MSETEIQETLDFLHELEDNKENNAYVATAITWVANNSIRLPQDHEKVRRIFAEARKRGVDVSKHKTYVSLLMDPKMQPKKKERATFDPDKATTFTNKHNVTTESGRVFTVYDVANTEEGQREVCKAVAAHYVSSPWCLSTFTESGEPTQSAKKYWNNCNAIPRKIAYENGRPVAFSNDELDYYGEEKSLITRLDALRTHRDRLEESIRTNIISLRQKINGGVYNSSEIPEVEESIRRKEYLLDHMDEAYKEVDEEIAPILQKLDELKIKRQSEEGWWDLLDEEPQPTLSDNIVDIAKVDNILMDDTKPLSPETVERYLLTEIAANETAFFKTSKGELYGFLSQRHDIYLDEDIINAEHPIHEYTHLWDKVVQMVQPELWNTGVELMKKTSLWTSKNNLPRHSHGRANVFLCIYQIKIPTYRVPW